MARRKKQNRSLESPAVPLWSPAAYNYLGSARATSGVSVDRITVYSIPAFYRAVKLICDKIARLPLNVFKKTSDGGRIVDTEHPAQWLLAHHPSPLYTPFMFRHTMIAHALVHGNAYAWIIRDEVTKAPIELVILNPENTGLKLEKGKLGYFTRLNGNDVAQILPENIFHLRNLANDCMGLVGLSVMDILREALGLSIASQRFASRFFNNNGTSNIIFKFEHKMDQTQIDLFLSQFSNRHVGLDNQHRPIVLANGGDAMSFPVTAEDLQLIQTRSFEISCAIANITGCPPHKLGVSIGGVSYNSRTADEAAFLSDTIDGWLCNWEEEAELKLLKYSQKVRDSHFIQFDRRSLEQADAETRSRIIIQERNNGLLTDDEARAELNRPPVKVNGDVRYSPTNVLPILDEPPPLDRPGSMDLTSSEDNTSAGDPDETSQGKATEEPRFTALLSSVLTRYVQRVRKDAERQAKGDWQAWVREGLCAAHRAVLVDTLSPVTTRAESEAEGILGDLREELASVTRDQVSAVFDRVNVEEWVERLVK